ncbi:hypothetical protein JOD20_001691 [Herpetosiphon giganteus]|nr:hypothetical protein [Herpetosiphon giganteus]
MYTIPSASIPLAKIVWFGIKKALLYALIAFLIYLSISFLVSFNNHTSIIIRLFIVIAMFLSIPSLIYTAILVFLKRKLSSIKIYHYLYMLFFSIEIHLIIIIVFDNLFSSSFRTPLIEQIISVNQQTIENILEPATILSFINAITFILPPIIAVFTLYRCQQQKWFYQPTT